MRHLLFLKCNCWRLVFLYVIYDREKMCLKFDKFMAKE